MKQCSIERRKSYVDKPDARKPIDFNLLRISPGFLIDQNNFLTFFIHCCAISNDMVFNRSEARSQNNRQLSSCIRTRISNKT